MYNISLGRYQQKDYKYGNKTSLWQINDNEPARSEVHPINGLQ